MGGVIDEAHAKKICDLYNLAINNGAPVIGIFDSCGTDIFAGTSGLSAYGKILACVNKARSFIPQIAYVTGKCIGTAAAIAATFDVVVKEENASLYVTSPLHTGVNNAQDSIVAFNSDSASCAGYIRNLVEFLPDNSSREIYVSDTTDSLNRLLGDLDFGGEALSAIASIVDNGVYNELGHDSVPAVSTVLASIGGVKCGIIATSYNCNEGKITKDVARKITRFIDFLDRFSLPIVTLVDSLGLAIDKENEMTFAEELAGLASSYAAATVPKVTVITGHAIGASFVLLGSKALGADLVYATDKAEIGALNAESGVAFAWDQYITLDKTREDLINEWKSSVSSPAVAAASGEIDDIISINELRARICSALLMLSSKGKSFDFRRKILPL
jgi:acetyl-CoA carboxylase carboxyltransferase component